MGAACGGAEVGAREREGELPVRVSPELKQATGAIDARIRELESWILKAEQEAKTLAARAGTDPAAKARAVRLLKQKRQYEEHRDRLLGTQFNVENMKFQEEQAEVTLMAAQAMQDGHQRLLKQKEQVGDVQDIERLQEDIHELAADLSEAQDLMAKSGEAAEILAPSAELEAEFARMQAELAHEASEEKRMLREAAQVADEAAYAKVGVAANAEALTRMSTGKLKALARYHGVNIGGCSEKADVLAALQAAGIQSPAQPAQTGAGAPSAASAQPAPAGRQALAA